MPLGPYWVEEMPESNPHHRFAALLSIEIGDVFSYTFIYEYRGGAVRGLAGLKLEGGLKYPLVEHAKAGYGEGIF